MTCQDIMTPEPTCCLPNETVARIGRVMRAQDIGSVPICDDRHHKQLLGIVTDRDLALKVVAEGRDPNTTRAEDIMTRHPVTCHSYDDILAAIEAMETHQVRRIPVTDGNGLLGIISQADIALRYGRPDRTAEVVEQVSKAATHRD